MLTRWSDFNRLFGLRELERTFSAFDELRRRSARGSSPERQPFMHVADEGDHLEVTVDVPGVPQDAIGVTLENDLLIIRGQRKEEALEGYRVHRRERPDLSFTQSLVLPTPVDGERTKAVVEDGVLTVTMAKLEAVKPRQITVAGAR